MITASTNLEVKFSWSPLIQQLGGPQTTNTVVQEFLGQIRKLIACEILEFDTDPYRI